MTFQIQIRFAFLADALDELNPPLQQTFTQADQIFAVESGRSTHNGHNVLWQVRSCALSDHSQNSSIAKCPILRTDYQEFSLQITSSELSSSFYLQVMEFTAFPTIPDLVWCTQVSRTMPCGLNKRMNKDTCPGTIVQELGACAKGPAENSVAQPN